MNEAMDRDRAAISTMEELVESSATNLAKARAEADRAEAAVENAKQFYDNAEAAYSNARDSHNKAKDHLSLAKKAFVERYGEQP